jgi:hypothetical protein
MVWRVGRWEVVVELVVVWVVELVVEVVVVKARGGRVEPVDEVRTRGERDEDEVRTRQEGQTLNSGTQRLREEQRARKEGSLLIVSLSNLN